MLVEVGAILLVLFFVAICIAAIAGREEHRRAMLAEEAGDDAPGDRADGLWLPSLYGDQPHVMGVFHIGTNSGKAKRDHGSK